MKRALIYYNRGLEKYVARYADDVVLDIKARAVGRCLTAKGRLAHKGCENVSAGRPLALSSC